MYKTLSYKELYSVTSPLALEERSSASRRITKAAALNSSLNGVTPAGGMQEGCFALQWTTANAGIVCQQISVEVKEHRCFRISLSPKHSFGKREFWLLLGCTSLRFM